MESKLTVLELKNYLGTGLKCLDPKNDSDYRVDSEIPVQFEVYGLTDEYAMIDCSVLQTDCDFADIKPLMFRLQDLDKFIPELGFVPLDQLYLDAGHKVPFNKVGMMLWKKSTLENILMSQTNEFSFGIIQKLFQWHFWVFDQSMFEKGLIIDKLKHDGK